MCDVEQCFYCRFPFLNESHEHDHFPTPLRHGGEQVVAVCARCHAYKDRILFADWPPDLPWKAMESIFEKCSPFERLVLAKFFKVAIDAIERSR